MFEAACELVWAGSGVSTHLIPAAKPEAPAETHHFRWGRVTELGAGNALESNLDPFVTLEPRSPKLPISRDSAASPALAA
jgi:hypothetical protein